MKVYCQEFDYLSSAGIAYPREPVQFKSITAAVRAYKKFQRFGELFGYGTPAAADLYIGDISEVEYLNGVWLYPEFPYMRLYLGTRNGVLQKRW